MLLECAPGLVEVHLGQGCVVRTPGRDQDVVDGSLEVGEEVLDGSQVIGIERRGAPRADLIRRVLQPLGVATGEDDVGAPRFVRALPSPARCRRCHP